MVKILIKLKDVDDFDKVDNSEAIEQITNFAKEFWNCESIKVIQKE